MDENDNKLYSLVQHYLKDYIDNPIKNFIEKDSVTFLKISTQVILLNLIKLN